MDIMAIVETILGLLLDLGIDITPVLEAVLGLIM